MPIYCVIFSTTGGLTDPGVTARAAPRMTTTNCRRPLNRHTARVHPSAPDFIPRLFHTLAPADVSINITSTQVRNSLFSFPPHPHHVQQDPTYIIKSTKVVEEEDVRSVLSDEYTSSDEQETTDIYLLPPNEDPETCTSWLRMRNRNGRYTLMFEETVCDGDVMISPRIKFEVGFRILGGLMVSFFSFSYRRLD